jgi:transposase
MVCGRDGQPLAVELWPGSTTDVETVQTQIDLLRKRFGIEKGVFVGDNGMYSEVNRDYIAEKGFSYIIGGEYHKKKELFCSMSKGQRELFVDEGIYEWVEGDVRYIGCYSERGRHRNKMRREDAMRAEQHVYLVVTFVRSHFCVAFLERHAELWLCS